MCGIHLIVQTKAVSTAQGLDKALALMLDAAQHRGKDGQGQWATSEPLPIALGHNLLQIADIHPFNRQPIQSDDGRYVLAFNGQIYNHHQLRQALPPRDWQSQSDAETLLYHLAHKGAKGLESLAGMYALIYYDRQTQRLLIAQDPWQMKPLYYAQTPTHLLFSSEIQSLLASGLMPRQLNEAAIPHYLQYRYAPHPQTFYQGVYAWQGAAYFSLFEQRFEALNHGSQCASETDHPAPMPLQEAVLRHLPAAVPTGLMLSGGVDSSLLALSVAQVRPSGGMLAFSLQITDSQQLSDDFRYATVIARACRMPLVEVRASAKALEASFEAIIGHTDSPIADIAAFSTYWIAETAARQGVYVLWSGAGADELLGGYRRHQWYAQYHQWKPWSHWAAAVARKVLPRRWQQYSRARRQALGLQANPVYTMQTLCALSSPLVYSTNTLTPEPQRFDLKGFLQMEQQHYLPYDILRLNDQMAMRHSVELRMPYLDTAFTEWAQCLSNRYLCQNPAKWPLKQALIQLSSSLGTSIGQRPKQGFGLPIGQYMRQAPLFWKQYFDNPQAAIFKYVPYGAVAQQWQAHQRGQADFSTELLSVALLAVWIQQRFG
ncbi:asparagine synthase (glutamine-hydrolyzing) [Eisenibacter elegans]|jgi:asparagine synthase (glutamine-hydrolysing)|uniref:asparagine synthase (glutamine-hydrolyzing) n=1 Tax=Eisenibacter elegans TaxID=997 RepID=UPI00040D6127|nr:asparagine synthase (glutamine-hydrolyzing) [Eisenibacter elegans]